MASGYSLTRQKIADLLNGVTDGGSLTLATARIHLGWLARAASDTDAYNVAKADGPFVLIGFASGEMPWSTWGLTRIPIHIYIAKPKETSWNGKDLEDLAAAVHTKLNDGSLFTSGTFAPERIMFEGIEYEWQVSPGLAVIKLAFECFDPDVGDIGSQLGEGEL